MVELARDADLLLAEASFADRVPERSAGGLNCAAGAGRQAAAAGVRRLVLTHLFPTTDLAGGPGRGRRGVLRAGRRGRPGLVVAVRRAALPGPPVRVGHGTQHAGAVPVKGRHDKPHASGHSP